MTGEERESLRKEENKELLRDRVRERQEQTKQDVLEGNV